MLAGFAREYVAAVRAATHLQLMGNQCEEHANLYCHFKIPLQRCEPKCWPKLVPTYPQWGHWLEMLQELSKRGAGVLVVTP